jgi:hypothetical protein
MGRMSPLHNLTVLVGGQSIPPVSRNGDTPNVTNGTAINLRTTGARGAMFLVNAGALTGAANYAAYLQTSDSETDPTNGNWTNVNATLYTNAAFAAKTNANVATELSYDGTVGGVPNVRAVLAIAANVAVIGVTHIVY